MSQPDFNPPECAWPFWGSFTSAMVQSGLWPNPVLMTLQNRPEWLRYWYLFVAGITDACEECRRCRIGWRWETGIGWVNTCPAHTLPPGSDRSDEPSAVVGEKS